MEHKMVLPKLTKKQKKYVSCVAKVTEKSKKKVNPYAICRKSVNYNGTTKNIDIRQRLGKIKKAKNK